MMGYIAGRMTAGALVMLCVATSGCSRGTSTSTSPADAARTQATAAQEQQRQPFEARDAQAAATTAAQEPLHLRLLKDSGLEAELGGPAAAESALQALAVQFRRYVLRVKAEAPRFVFTADAEGNPRYDGFSTSLMLSYLMSEAVGEAASTPDTKGTLDKDSSAEPNTDPAEPKSTIKVKLDQGQAEATSTVETTTGSLTGTIKTRLQFDLCPKADGSVHLSFMSDSRLRSTASGVGANVTVTVEQTRFVNDNAEFITSEIDQTARVEAASFGGGGSNTYVEYQKVLSTVKGEMSGRALRTSSRATQTDVDNAASMAAMATVNSVALTSAAEKSFRSGRCVTLKPTSTPGKRTGVKPGTSFSIDAAPRSTIDGTPTGGTVRADLSGGASLQPAGTNVKADAQFTYVAPGEKQKTATITFEARSKRGIGKATLDFQTEQGLAFIAEGGLDDFQGTGTICDFSQPFEISGRGVVNKFVPTSPTTGTYSYTGNLGGFTVFGSGTYTATFTEQGGLMLATGPGTVVTPFGNRTARGTERYTLTPTTCP